MIQKSSMATTLTLFYDNPTTKFSLASISQKTKLAHTSTKNNLINLIKKNIITKIIEKKGKRNFPEYIANRNEKLFILTKKVQNLNNLLNSGLISHIEEQIFPKSIVLFGSYSRGEDIETSDIDIYIEAPKTELNLKPFEKKLTRKIELHFQPNFKEYPNELKNNIINGSILQGYLEAFP